MAGKGPGMEWGRARGWAPRLEAGPDAGLAPQVQADIASQMASWLTPVTLLLLRLLAGVSGPSWDGNGGVPGINPSGPGEGGELLLGSYKVIRAAPFIERLERAGDSGGTQVRNLTR